MKSPYKVMMSSTGWTFVRESALTTVHKEHTEDKVSKEWKTKILLSEHTPIRELIVVWKVPEVERWVADQLVRSRDNSYMGTMREDRGNKPRSEQTMDTLTVMMKSSNAQNIIDTARKRLCRKASKETAKLYQTFVDGLKIIEPELASLCVPNCIYRAGCPEFRTCGLYKKFYKENKKELENADIRERYTLYQAWQDSERTDKTGVHRQLDLAFVHSADEEQQKDSNKESNE